MRHSLLREFVCAPVSFQPVGRYDAVLGEAPVPVEPPIMPDAA